MEHLVRRASRTSTTAATSFPAAVAERAETVPRRVEPLPLLEKRSTKSSSVAGAAGPAAWEGPPVAALHRLRPVSAEMAVTAATPPRLLRPIAPAQAAMWRRTRRHWV